MKNTEMLKKNYEFKHVLTKGKYCTGKYIEAFFIDSAEKKIGIAIGKKQAKAVKRNYLKRLIKENYRLNEEMLKEGKSIVFLVKKKVNINEISFFKVKEDMIEILKKVGQV